MQYAAVRLKKNAETAAFRIYLADSIYFLARGQALEVRWRNWISEEKAPSKEADPEKIKNRIKAGLKGLMP